LRALKVVGPSVNELYPDGSYVFVVSAADTDVRQGDKVVVFRRQGALCEATIKEVRVDDDGRVVLHPRSTHPDHQEPIYLEPEDQDGPEIAYVVVGSYRPEERPPPPIQIPRRR
jgi:phage repressor protein C with HTH and peptisase S24 domain